MSDSKCWEGRREEEGERMFIKTVHTWTNIFCNKMRLSVIVNSHPSSTVSSSGRLGRSKKRYRHLTRVDGSDAAVIQSIRAWSPTDSRLMVLSSVQPLLLASLDSISRNLTIAQLAASVSETTHRNLLDNVNKKLFPVTCQNKIRVLKK